MTRQTIQEVLLGTSTQKEWDKAYDQASEEELYQIKLRMLEECDRLLGR